MKFIASVVCVLLLAFVGCMSFAISTHAQTTDATVSGQITDPTGRVVPGVTVVLTNLNTNVPYTTQTNSEGIYRFSAVQPGIYRANVTKDGFASIVKGEIELHVQDQVSINFALKVGSVSETMTIVAGAPMINTTDASVGTVVDQSYIENMPLNGRSLQDLVLLTPGILTETPQIGGALNGGDFSVNGLRTEANNYMVDGVSANVGALPGNLNMIRASASGSLPASTAEGTTQALISVDALQEFRVNSSTYSAEYGRNPGAQLGFESKSGVNQWHGTAFDYLRNDIFDANDWFNNYNNVAKPPLRQNDFGGTLGGPLDVAHVYNGKDKTFFFFSYEGLRLLQPQEASTDPVPDACLRGASATCPAGITPAPSALQPALNAFPMPNGPEIPCDPNADPTCTSGGGSGMARFTAASSNPSSIDSSSIRLDHVVKDKVRLFFRFSNSDSSATTRQNMANSSNTPSVISVLPQTVRTYTGGASTLFSSRVSNDIRVNYSSNILGQGLTLDGFGGSVPVDLRQLSGLDARSAATLNLCFSGCSGTLFQFHSPSANRQWNLVDTVNLSKGRHQFKFGADYRRLTPYTVQPISTISYTYSTVGDVESNSAQTQASASNPAYPLYLNFSAFAQDQWHVTPRLNLSMGLRWEVNPAPGAAQGLKPYTLVGTTPDNEALAPQGKPLWKTTWYNFAPRLGAAYMVRNAPGWETVVRAGGGLFFDTGQQLGSFGYIGPGFRASSPQQVMAFPASAPSLIPTIQNPPTAPYQGTPVGYSPHLQLPYALEWNGSIEQSLGKDQALTVSYVGSHGSRLQELNFVLPSNNPNTSFYEFIQSGSTSDYHSLQTELTRRLSHGLTALASYTWSHCLDYGSNNSIFGYQRGNCDFDVRHNFSAAFSYTLPNVGQNIVARALLHGWGIDDRFMARTAFPVTLVGAFGGFLPNGQFFDDGVDLVPGVPVYLYGANCASTLQAAGELLPGQGCPGGRAINPNAFNETGNLGNSPRNFARLFGMWQMNLALRREFPIHERLKLQFRAETFNLFNHPNFGQVDDTFFDPTFGLAIHTLANSLGGLSPIYQSGAARSMQFALKLLF